MRTRSGPVSSTPEGTTAFCACRAAMTACWSMPKAASLEGDSSR